MEASGDQSAASGHSSISSSSSSSSSPSSSFPSALALSQSRVPHVPQRYVLPPSQRPCPCPNISTTLPILDLSSLETPTLRTQLIKDIGKASKQLGFFQVINHGIPISVMKDALSAADEFFNLPLEEKMLLGSDSVHAPVRYGTSMNQALDRVYYWRDFIKHYSHPLPNWIHLWPSNPPCYKVKMGNYATAVQVLQEQIMGLVLESLGLNPNYLQEELGHESGSQLMAVNFYPACPEPELALGMPTHSDYGSITILLQSCPGLQVTDQSNNWQPVAVIEGALLVQLGDQMEVLSNGQYKSVLHRATLSAERSRLSIASLHSLGLDKKIGPAPMLVDDQHPNSYKEFSFKDFLDYITNNDIVKGRFIDTMKR